ASARPLLRRAYGPCRRRDARAAARPQPARDLRRGGVPRPVPEPVPAPAGIEAGDQRRADLRRGRVTIPVGGPSPPTVLAPESPGTPRAGGFFCGRARPAA